MNSCLNKLSVNGVRLLFFYSFLHEVVFVVFALIDYLFCLMLTTQVYKGMWQPRVVMLYVKDQLREHQEMFWSQIVFLSLKNKLVERNSSAGKD